MNTPGVALPTEDDSRMLEAETGELVQGETQATGLHFDKKRVGEQSTIVATAARIDESLTAWVSSDVWKQR